MSALLTHAAVGVLLGLALRWPAKWLPLAALLAALPDVDHLDMWWDQPVLRSRATLHNVFACALIPLLIWMWLRLRGGAPTHQKLAAGSAVLLSSHILLDLLPLDPAGGIGRVALFFPFSARSWMLRAWNVDTTMPWAVTTLTMLVALLIVSVLLARALEQGGSRRVAPWQAGIVVLWLLALPLAGLGGAVIEEPAWGEARLAMEDAVLELPHGRIAVTVYHITGDLAGGLRVELLSNGKSIANGSVGHSMGPGERLGVSFPAGPDPRNLTRMNLRLYGPAEHTYAWAAPGFRLSHIETAVNITRVEVLGDRTHFSLRNEGNALIPNGSLEARLIRNSSSTVNMTVGPAIRPGETLELWFLTASAGAAVEIRSIDDRTAYARRAVEGLP